MIWLRSLTTYQALIAAAAWPFVLLAGSYAIAAAARLYTRWLSQRSPDSAYFVTFGVASWPAILAFALLPSVVFLVLWRVLQR